MTQKEAEDIAWELFKLESTFEIKGVDSVICIANQAQDTLDNIIEKHPKIKHELEKWRMEEEG